MTVSPHCLPAFPTKPSTHSRTRVQEGQRSRQKLHRILVVDDNEDAVFMLEKILTNFGYAARSSTSGAQALEVGAEFEPDAVVLDLGMPGMDGFETARRLRLEHWGEDVLLIALTGWGQPEDIRRTREAGFQAHLVKPLELDHLLALLTDPRGTA